MNRFAAVLTGIWLGMQLMAGYLVAPLLFRYLPEQQDVAGRIAGELFDWVAYFGLVAWALAYAVVRTEVPNYGFKEYRQPPALIWIALLIILQGANVFFVAPVIEALKTKNSHWLLSLTGGDFAVWHSISSTIYLVCSLLGFALSVYYLRYRTKHFQR